MDILLVFDKFIPMKNNRPLLYVALGLLILVITPMLFKSLYVEETGKISQLGVGTYLFIVFGLYKEWKWMARLVIVLMAILLFLSLFVLFSWPDFRLGFLINIAAILIIAYYVHQLKFLKTSQSTSND